MRLFLKTINPSLINKAYAVFYQTKIASDIINNVLINDIEVKNQEAYDKIYESYIKNTIQYDKVCQDIEKSLFGNDVIIPGATTYVSPARGKFIVKLDDDLIHKEDIENFLIKRGFDCLDVE